MKHEPVVARTIQVGSISIPIDGNSKKINPAISFNNVNSVVVSPSAIGKTTSTLSSKNNGGVPLIKTPPVIHNIYIPSIPIVSILFGIIKNTLKTIYKTVARNDIEINKFRFMLIFFFDFEEVEAISFTTFISLKYESNKPDKLPLRLL